MDVFGLWEEAGGNPYMHRETMQTPNRYTQSIPENQTRKHLAMNKKKITLLITVENSYKEADGC